MIRKVREDELDELLTLYTHMCEQDDPLPDPKTVQDVWSSNHE